MSTVARPLSVNDLPLYLLLQRAVPTRTLRSFVKQHGNARRVKRLDRQRCLEIIHQKGIISSVREEIENRDDLEVFCRGRILFMLPQESGGGKELFDYMSSSLPSIAPLRFTDSSRLELVVDRGDYKWDVEIDGAGLMVYERAFMYSYRGQKLWIIPLSGKDNPYITIGRRRWIPFLVSLGSSNFINLGMTIKESLDLASTDMRFTSYQPAGIALVGYNDHVGGLEIRVYGPSNLTRRARILTQAFYAIMRSVVDKNNGIDVYTGYNISSIIGPNKIAKELYEQVKDRQGIVVSLRITGLKYVLIAFGGVVGADRISADETAAEVLNYNSAEEFFEDLAARGEPTITYFSLRLPRSEDFRSLLDMLERMQQRAKVMTLSASTYKYLGVNTVNLSLFTYSGISERRLQEEIRSLIAEPLRKAQKDIAALKEGVGAQAEAL